MSQTSDEQFEFANISFAALDKQAALDRLFDFAARRETGYVTCANTHSVVEAAEDARLGAILNGALLNVPDGMPVAWVGRAKGFPAQRVTGPDLLEGVANDPRGAACRHFFYGGAPDSLAKLVERATTMLGSAAVVGSHSPPLRQAGDDEDEKVLAAIRALDPHFIWVGLGLPKQEYWMERYSCAFPGTVMVGVGAAFDWFAGVKPRAPDAMQNMGLEWAFRLATEPRRLAGRYLHVLPRALWLMAKDLR
jgi:N-acetylglucosaminyldiphosphoundecaprenol N-acetyl-beta-D-mannosaminyltransferase